MRGRVSGQGLHGMHLRGTTKNQHWEGNESGDIRQKRWHVESSDKVQNLNLMGWLLGLSLGLGLGLGPVLVTYLIALNSVW